MFFFVSWQTGIFRTIRDRDALHLTLQQLGDLGAISMFVSVILQYPAGWLADKWNPIRVFTLTTIVTFGQNIIQCVFIFYEFTPKTNLLIMYWLSFTLMPFVVLHGAAEIPMYMRLLPKERYGQFCSANAMIRSFCLIFGSILAGYFMDSLENHFHMGDHRYTYYSVWAVAFQIPAFFFLWLLYREWMRRGGDKGYTPPEAGAPSGGGVVVAAPAPRH
jgi:MFS family permease